jgi:hypothetical protein
VKPLLIALACVAAGGAGYAIYLKNLPAEAAMTAACEKELKVRLKAPATYKRVETLLLIEPATAAEALGEISDSASKNAELVQSREMLRKLYEQRPPYRHQLLITYDSANSYGTPIRGAARCETFNLSSEPLTTEDLRIASSLRINGKTNGKWLIEQLNDVEKAIRQDKKTLRQLRSLE